MVTNKGADLPKLAAPARRALIEAGYTRLEQLTRVTETDLTKLHGIGPTAMQTLRAALHERGLSFRCDVPDIDIDLSYALDIELSTRFRPYRLDEAPFEELRVTARLDLEVMEIEPELLTSAGLPLEWGRGQRTLVELHCGEDLVLVLDERDADSLNLASHLFIGDELKSHVEEICEIGFSGCVLLMDYFALDPAWRGLGLGPLISLATMRTLTLGHDITCAALYAAPLPTDHEIPNHERRQIAKKIKSAWQRCGFEELAMTDEGWIMVASGVGASTWPDELWPGLLNEVNAAVNDHIARRISLQPR